MAAVPAGCSRGPWDWWEWQKRASDSSSRGSGDQPRVLPRPSSRVPLARTNFWLSLLGLLAKIKGKTYLVYGSPRVIAIRSRACKICSQARFRPGGERRSGVLIFFPPEEGLKGYCREE